MEMIGLRLVLVVVWIQMSGLCLFVAGRSTDSNLAEFVLSSTVVMPLAVRIGLFSIQILLMMDIVDGSTDG